MAEEHVYHLAIKLKEVFLTNLEDHFFDLFITPLCKYGDEEQDAIAFVKKFVITQDKQSLLVLGDSGLGKTILAKFITQEFWKHYEYENDFIPLYIYLPFIPIHKRKNNLLESFLKKQGLDEHQRNKLFHQGKLLLILDGYDEISDPRNLWEQNNWSIKNIKVITLCRNEALLKYTQIHNTYITLFIPPSQELKRSYQSYTEMTLIEFKPEQVEAYIARYLGIHHAENKKELYLRAQAFLKHIPGLQTLIQVPVILSMMVQVLPDLLHETMSGESQAEQALVTRIKIYDYFVRHWFQKQAYRIQKQQGKLTHIANLEELLKIYSENLARDLLKLQRLDVVIEEDKTLEIGLLYCSDPQIMKYVKDLTVEDLKTVRSGCLLKTTEGFFQFLHKSLLEYLAANDLFKGVIGKLTLAIGDSLKEKQLSSFNEKLLVDEFSIIRNLADRIQTNPKFEKWLFDVVDLSKQDDSVAIAAANAITVLNCARISFSSRDFRGIRIPGANLTQALCHQTDFTDADLEGVCFKGAYLASAKFKDAYMKSVDFGQFPKFKTKKEDGVYSRGTIYHVCCSPDGQWLAGMGGEGYLSIWSLNNFQLQYSRKSSEFLNKIKHGDFTYRKITFNQKSNCLIIERVSGKNHEIEWLVAINIKKNPDGIFRFEETEIFDDLERIRHDKYANDNLYLYIIGKSETEIVFNQDKTLSAKIVGQNEIQIWNLTTNKIQASHRASGRIAGLFFDIHNRFLLSLEAREAYEEASIEAWPVVTDINLIYMPRQNKLKVVTRLEVESARALVDYKRNGRLNSNNTTSSDDLFVASLDGKKGIVVVKEKLSGRILYQYSLPFSWQEFFGSYDARTLEFSPNNNWLVCQTLGYGLTLLDLKRKTSLILNEPIGIVVALQSLMGKMPESLMRGLAFSEDSQFLIITLDNGLIKIWHLESQKYQFQFQGQDGSSTELKLNGELINSKFYRELCNEIKDEHGSDLAYKDYEETLIWQWDEDRKQFLLTNKGTNNMGLCAWRMDIQDTIGLSAQNQLLLEQLAATGKPSQYPAKRYRSQNNLPDVASAAALIPVELQHSVIDTNPDKLVSYENWVVSLMRHPQSDNPDHAILFLEGINQFGKAFFIKLHLVDDRENPGKALIIVQHYPNITLEEREIFFKRDLVEQKTYICKSWNISRNQGLSLLKDAKTDQEKNIHYHISGDRSIFAKLSSKTDSPVHNCFTWARAKLLNLNDPQIQLPEKFTDFVGAKTSFYLPDSAKENASCSLM